MTRHPFEPARLLLGVLLMAAGAAYVLDAAGVLDVPTPLLLALVPVALILGAVAGLVGYLLRRARRRAEDAEPERRTEPADPVEPVADFPFEELRRGYEGTRGPRHREDD